MYLCVCVEWCECVASVVRLGDNGAPFERGRLKWRFASENPFQLRREPLWGTLGSAVCVRLGDSARVQVLIQFNGGFFGGELGGSRGEKERAAHLPDSAPVAIEMPFEWNGSGKWAVKIILEFLWQNC